MQKFRMIAGSVLPGTGTDNAGLHMEIGHGTPIFSQCLIALAFARAGRGANTPVFLLTDEKVLGVVVESVVSRRSSSRRGAPRPGLIALASARAGRGANTPAFLLTDEKVLGSWPGWSFLVARRPDGVLHDQV